MTTYKEIKGDVVERVASDPTNPGEGDIWYNTTTGVLKGQEFLESFTSGGNLSVSRTTLGGAGTLTAGLAYGGTPTPGPASVSTEEYNGTSWSGGGNLPVGREGVGGTGTQTAAFAVAGSDGTSPASLTSSDDYDGSSWTSSGTVGTAMSYHTAFGTQTAGFVAGGRGNFPFPKLTNTYTYDGSTFSSSTALPAGTDFLSSAGTSTAGIVFLGRSPSENSNSFEWNGSSWTAGGSLGTARYSAGGLGIQTAALAIGGIKTPNTYQSATEKYDGTSWTTSDATLATARGGGAASTQGTTTSAFYAGGANAPSASPYLTATEEFTSGTATQTLTTS